MKTITIRGYTIAVQARSGSQLAAYINLYNKLTNAQLESRAAETRVSKLGLFNEALATIAAQAPARTWGS